MGSTWIHQWDCHDSQLGSNRTQHVDPSRATHVSSQFHQDPPHGLAKIHHVDHTGIIPVDPLESTWIHQWDNHDSQMGSNRTQHVEPSIATTWIKPDPQAVSTRMTYMDQPGSITWIHQVPSCVSNCMWIHQESPQGEGEVIDIWNFFGFFFYSSDS